MPAPNHATAQMLYYTLAFYDGCGYDPRPSRTAERARNEWHEDARLYPNDKRGYARFRTDPSVDWVWITNRLPAYWIEKETWWFVHNDWEQMAAADGYIKLPDVGGDEPAAEDEEHDDDCTCGVCEDDFTNAGERAME